MTADGNKYETYFSKAPTGIFVVDATGRYLEANAAACALVGRSQEELLSMSIGQLVSPETAEETLLLFQRLVETGKVAWQEVTLVHKDGSIVYLTLDAARIDDDRYVGYCSDLGLHKETQAKLRESDLRFRFTMEQFPASAWAVDTDLCFTSSFGAGLVALGLLPDEVVGKSLYEYFDTENSELLPIRNHLLALAGESVQYEFAFNNRVFDSRLQPLQDASGKVIGVCGVAFDISDRVASHRRETQLQRKTQQLRKLESLGVLAGGIAHDFNNLLMSIAGNAELAMRSLSQRSPHLESIVAATTRATDLANQMLSYSGKGSLVLQPVDLSEVVHEASSVYEDEIDGTASVSYKLSKHLPAIEADREQLRQVVIALVLNAAEALEGKPGTIIVSTSAGYCDRSMLESPYLPELAPEGEYLTLEVSDPGTGMDKDTRKSLFDPFYSTKFAGRGLGLAVVLGVVREQGGIVQVESKPGSTTLRVRLPVLARKLISPVPQATPTDSSGSSSKLVLVVDDEISVRNTIRDMLVSEGFSVLVAEDGLDALTQFQSRMNEIDCLILDLTMPGLDGVATLQRLRAIKPDVRAIVASGYSERVITERFGEQPSAFLRKPFTITAMLAALNSVLGQT